MGDVVADRRILIDDTLFQWRASGGRSPGPCSRAIRSSIHSGSLPSVGTRVDRKGLVQLHTCGSHIGAPDPATLQDRLLRRDAMRAIKYSHLAGRETSAPVGTRGAAPARRDQSGQSCLTAIFFDQLTLMPAALSLTARRYLTIVESSGLQPCAVNCSLIFNKRMTVLDRTLTGRLFEPSACLTQMTTYAQNFEDVLLRRALQDLANGFWVDVGANHPRDLSVTKWFSDQGWTGINIEPNPSFLRLLQAERLRDVNIGAAVGSHVGETTLHVVGDTGLTTTRVERTTPTALLGHQVTETITVPVTTLNAVLETHAPNRVIDFLKIDAEGSESEIINGLDLERFRPRIVVIENGEGYADTFAQAGYSFVWFDNINQYFLRREDSWRSDLLARPPNTMDNAIPAALIEAREALRVCREENERVLIEAREELRVCREENERVLIEAREALRVCRDENERVLASASWRYTKSLRWLRGLMRPSS
jgi:FkbM family methyltransferase